MNPLVSIIVPCYNQAQYLPETLNSVFAQTYQNWECIIVNDGSPDNTEEIAKEYCDKDNRFKYLFKENGGISEARNTGIIASSGEFVLPLDSDDLIGVEYIEKAIQYFQKSPETKLVYCKANLFGKINIEWLLPEYCYDNLLFDNMIFCSAIFRRKDFDNSPGYDHNMKNGLEDWDFWLKFLDKHDVVYQLPFTLFYYRIKSHSRNANVKDKVLYELTRQIYYNHKEKYADKLDNIVWYGLQNNMKEEKISNLEFQLSQIRSSKAYKFGKFLFRPYSMIRRLLNI